MTPYELWFTKKPKLSFLKVWGCDAYVKKFQPNKLKPKSEKCVFIGYTKETVGYTYHRSEFEGRRRAEHVLNSEVPCVRYLIGRIIRLHQPRCANASAFGL